MDNLLVIKIGGNIIEDEIKLSSFLKDFSGLEGNKILVHGGGKLATDLAGKLGLSQTMVEGRRITDAATLNIITMVYAGLVNKKIVATLQSFQCNAMGLTGADADLIRSEKRTKGPIDYGFVGDVKTVNHGLLSELISTGITPVFSPVTHDGKGQLLNTNADTIAQEIAVSMSGHYQVNLVYCFEKAGVLRDVNDENSVISNIHPSVFGKLKEEAIISEGMIPKLENAMTALRSGVSRIVIGKAESLQSLVNGNGGTSITNE